MFASHTDIAWGVGGLVVIVGLWQMARWLDPHWVARDGRAFTCHVQPIRQIGSSGRRVEGRFRSSRAVVDGAFVRLTPRGLPNGAKAFVARPVLGRAPQASGRHALFVLGGMPNYVLRIPASSRAVAVLDSLCAPSVGGRPNAAAGTNAATDPNAAADPNAATDAAATVDDHRTSFPRSALDDSIDLGERGGEVGT